MSSSVGQKFPYGTTSKHFINLRYDYLLDNRSKLTMLANKLYVCLAAVFVLRYLVLEVMKKMPR